MGTVVFICKYIITPFLIVAGVSFAFAAMFLLSLTVPIGY